MGVFEDYMVLEMGQRPAIIRGLEAVGVPNISSSPKVQNSPTGTFYLQDDVVPKSLWQKRGETFDTWVELGSGTNYGSRVIVVGPSEQYTTIQAGLDASSDGDIIQVMPATYNLTAPIVVSKEVSIIGNSKAPSGVSIVAPTLGTRLNAFSIIANNVAITGMSIAGASARDDGNSAGIIITGSNAYIESVTFEDNIAGIFVDNAPSTTILKCTFVVSKIDNGAVDPTMTGCGIIGNCDSGFKTLDIEKCVFIMNQRAGIKLDGSVNIGNDTHKTVNANIIDNKFGSNRPMFGMLAEGFGIDITPGVKAVNIKNNLFEEHNSTVGTNFSNKSAGIRLNNTAEVLIDGNEFSGNLSGVLHYADAIQDVTSPSTDILIVNNKFFGNNRGVTVGDSAIAWGTSEKPVINNNEFVGNNLVDMLSEGIIAMGLYNETSSTLDARLNYWGDPSGPEDAVEGDGVVGGSGDTVNTSINLEPLITKGNRATDVRNDSSVAGHNVKDALDSLSPVISKSSKTLYVDMNKEGTYTANGSITAPYKTIQGAIDAVIATPTIEKIIINRGVYLESINITDMNALSIVAGRGEDVIISDSAVRPFRLENCQGIRFEGIEFYNNGVVTNANAVEVNGCTSIEFHNCKLNGGLNGIEFIWHAGNASSAEEVTFIDCTIKGSTNVGVKSSSGCLYTTSFKDCKITGKESAFIVFGYEDITIDNCELESTAPVSDSSCCAKFGIQANVTPVDASGLTIKNSSLMGCFVGATTATDLAVLSLTKEAPDAIGAIVDTVIQDIKIINWDIHSGIYLLDHVIDSSFVASGVEFLTANYGFGQAVNVLDDGSDYQMKNCWWGDNFGPNVTGSSDYDGAGGIIQATGIIFEPVVVRGSRGSDYRNDSNVAGKSITDALNNLSSIAGANAGGVFIVDVQPHNIGKSVSITYEAGLAVNVGYNVVESIVTDDNEVDVTVMTYGAGDSWQPEVVLNAGVPLTLTMQTGRQRQFEGTQLSVALGAGELIATTNQGNTHEVDVTIQAGPDIGTLIIGALPGTQTALKSGDDVTITGTTLNYNAGDEVRIVDLEGFVESAWIPVVDGGAGGGLFTFVNAVVSGRSGVGQHAYAESRNVHGAVGVQGISSNDVMLDQLFPVFSPSGVDYPATQGAIKNSESATVSTEVSQQGASPVFLYSSPTGELSIPDASTYAEDKSVTRISGDYNDSIQNYRVTVTRTENDATAFYEEIVEIANVAPVIAVTLPSVRLRSDLAANGGADHTVTITADQKIATTPTLNASSVVRGRLTAIIDSGNQKTWTGTMNVDDADEKGTFAWQGLTAINKSNLSTTIITTGGNYVLGGFFPRTITWSPGFNRIQPLGVRCSNFSKLSAVDNNANAMAHQTSALADANGGMPTYIYTITDVAQVLLATPNVNIDNYLYWSDTFSAQTNSTGTATITVEEAV